MRHRSPFAARAAVDYPFWSLILLLGATSLLGGSARDDVMSLIVLRPLAVLCLAMGLAGLTRQEISNFRAPLGVMIALLALILAHLVPLPPALWTALPGRSLAAEIAEAGGIAQPWRPIALVPWRAWNALYAMVVPAAAMVLAIRCRLEQRRSLVMVVLAFGCLSAIVGMLQAISGFSPDFYLYSISSPASPNGLFANRNHQAALLSCLFPVLAYFGLRSDNSWPRPLRTWGAASIASVLFLLLLTTGSRAGLLLALVSLASTTLVFRPFHRPEIRNWRRFATVGMGVLAALAIVALAVARSRADAIKRLLEMDASEGRLEHWQVIGEMIGKYFPAGSGVGSFVEVYKIDEPRAVLNFSYLNHAHNDWLEWILEGGIPVAVLMAVGVYLWGRRSLQLTRTLPERSEQVPLAAVGAIIILLLGLASFVDYPLRVPSLACLFAISAVWMVAPGSGGTVRKRA